MRISNDNFNKYLPNVRINLFLSLGLPPNFKQIVQKEDYNVSEIYKKSKLIPEISVYSNEK